MRQEILGRVFHNIPPDVFQFRGFQQKMAGFNREDFIEKLFEIKDANYQSRFSDVTDRDVHEALKNMWAECDFQKYPSLLAKFQRFAPNSNYGPLYWSDEFRAYKATKRLPAGKTEEQLIKEIEDNRKTRIDENNPEWVWDPVEKKDRMRKGWVPTTVKSTDFHDGDDGDDGDDGGDGDGAGGAVVPQARNRARFSVPAANASKRTAISRLPVQTIEISVDDVKKNKDYFITGVTKAIFYFTGGDSGVEFILLPHDAKEKVLCKKFNFVNMETFFPQWPKIVDCYDKPNVRPIFNMIEAPKVEVSANPYTNQMLIHFRVFPEVFESSITLIALDADASTQDEIKSLQQRLKDESAIYNAVAQVEKDCMLEDAYISLIQRFKKANHESLQGLLIASQINAWSPKFYPFAREAVANVLSRSTSGDQKTVDNIIAELFKECYNIPGYDKVLLTTFQDNYHKLLKLGEAIKTNDTDTIAQFGDVGDLSKQFRSDEKLLDMQQLWEEFKPTYTTYMAGKAAAEDKARQALIQAQEAERNAREEVARLQREQAEKEQAEAVRARAQKEQEDAARAQKEREDAERAQAQKEQEVAARAQKEQEDAARAQKEQEDAARVQETQRKMEELEKKIQELEQARKTAKDMAIMPVYELARAYLSSDQKKILTFNADQIADHLSGKELKNVRCPTDNGDAFMSQSEMTGRMDQVVTAINASMDHSIQYFKANLADFFLQIITIARGNSETVYDNKLKNQNIILAEIAQKFTVIAKNYAYWYQLIFTEADGVSIPSEEQQEEIVKAMFESLQNTYRSIDMNDVKDLYYTIIAIFFVETGVIQDIQAIYEGMDVNFEKFLFISYKTIAPKPVIIAFIDLTEEDAPAGGISAPDDSQGISLPARRSLRPRFTRNPKP
jgi:hypothetical protein